jgi:hypothetical protein
MLGGAIALTRVGAISILVGANDLTFVAVGRRRSSLVSKNGRVRQAHCAAYLAEPPPPGGFAAALREAGTRAERFSASTSAIAFSFCEIATAF